MKSIKYIILIAATASLSSCGVLKKYQRPTEITVEGIYGDAQSGDSLGMGDLKWREIFTDPTLQALIEKALAQNVDARNAALQLEEMNYALKASKLAFLPTFSFDPNGAVSKIYDSYNRSSTAAMTSSYSKTYAFGVTAGWINDNFLQLINQKRGAQTNVKQLDNAKQAVQAALVANVATMYYTLAELDEQLTLTKQTLENWGIYLNQEKSLMNAGQANLAAVANIEATYYSINQSVLTLENNIKILENQMSTLLGESNSHINRGALASFKAPAIVTTGAPISILTRRPDVRAAELDLEAQWYTVNQAKAEFFPSVTLSATGKFTNSAGSGIVNPGLFLTNYLLSLSQPLYKGGQIKAKVGIQKKKYEEAINDFQQSIISAGNEVNTAMLEIKEAEEQKELIGKQVSSLETALDATKKLYTLSSINYLNVITAQNSLLSAQMSQISNRMDAIQATIDLYQALGGGAEKEPQAEEKK